MKYCAMTTIMRFLTILLLSISLAGGMSGTASAADAARSPQEGTLLELINQARQNPLGVAASMGMDPEKILRDLPELEKILKEGLPPLTFNNTLYDAARAHTADMFANNYYSHVSPDGRGYEARIRDAGYPAVATGESLGMLVFANFIDPQDAARFLFEYMFADELDPARTEKRNILDPSLKEAGVSIDTGVLSLGGVLWNVYLATCDFGAVITEPEAELLRLINLARANPLGMAESLGIRCSRLPRRAPRTPRGLRAGPCAPDGEPDPFIRLRGTSPGHADKQLLRQDLAGRPDGLRPDRRERVPGRRGGRVPGDNVVHRPHRPAGGREPHF